jgi:hypothetical protein
MPACEGRDSWPPGIRAAMTFGLSLHLAHFVKMTIRRHEWRSVALLILGGITYANRPAAAAPIAG